MCATVTRISCATVGTRSAELPPRVRVPSVTDPGATAATPATDRAAVMTADPYRVPPGGKLFTIAATAFWMAIFVVTATAVGSRCTDRETTALMVVGCTTNGCTEKARV